MLKYSLQARAYRNENRRDGLLVSLSIIPAPVEDTFSEPCPEKQDKERTGEVHYPPRLKEV